MTAGKIRAGIRFGLLVLGLMVLIAWGPPDSPVADAAQGGDLGTVQALLRDGADPNDAQPDGMTALHWAAVNDHVEMIEVLLYSGSAVEPRTRLGGYTPLHLASRSGCEGAAHALLAGGADPDLVTATGVTALHFAADANSGAVVDALAAAGANLDALDTFAERTPLMFAAARNADDAVAALLARGADPGLTTRVKDYVELDRIADAEQERRKRVLEAAKEPVDEGEADVWAEGEEPPTTEPEPADEPEPDAEEETGSQDSEPANWQEEEDDKPDEPAWTHPDSARAKYRSLEEQVGKQGGFAAIHFAAREGHREAVELLIRAGAEVDQTTGGDRSTPLLVAVINGNYDVARDLLEAGADPNLVSEDQVGPLFAALNIEWSLRTWYPQPQAFRQQETTYLELMELLLEAGADPNQRTGSHVWYASYNAGRMGVDFTGATPFWRAAYAVDVPAMRLLVEHGADPNIWTMKIADRPRRVDPDVPSNPANSAQEPEDPSGLPPVPVGGPAVHPLHAASGVGFGTSRVAQQHRAAPGGWLPAVQYLVEEIGVDPNIRDQDGFTAIHHAAARGDNATILYLIGQGADVTLLSRRGHTTADMANSPEQRAQPLPRTVALLEKLGSLNSHQCQSCGGATR